MAFLSVCPSVCVSAVQICAYIPRFRKTLGCIWEASHRAGHSGCCNLRGRVGETRQICGTTGFHCPALAGEDIINLTHYGPKFMAKQIQVEKDGVGPRVLLITKAARVVSYFLRIFGVIEGSDDVPSIGKTDEKGALNREETLAPVLDALVCLI